MTRILLINPDWGARFSGSVRRYNRRFPPLDLLNCASLLKKAGHHVDLVDLRANPNAVIEHSYDLCFLTLSPLDRWQCPNTDLAHIRSFLRGFPLDRLVIMGAQVTVKPEHVMETLGVSRAILGEPEQAVVSLANGGVAGEVPGTAFWANETLTKGAAHDGMNLSELPLPAYELIDVSQYRYEVLGSNLGLLELTRGCPWRCKFCLLAMYPKKYRRKPIDQMIEEIRHAQAHGMKCAYFQDLEFTLDHELVGSLCESMLSEGITLKWACQTRPDTIDLPLLQLMNRAGCDLIHYGVESGVQHIVDKTQKKQSLEAVENGVQLAKQVGMRTLCYFLIGLPGEKVDEIWQTLDFAQRIQPTYASFQVATPYPGTAFYSEGQFEKAFPDAFSGELDATRLRQLARRLTIRYHLSFSYIGQRLKHIGDGTVWREMGLLLDYIRS